MDDLEEFLRRAAEKRQARKEGVKPPAARPAPPKPASQQRPVAPSNTPQRPAQARSAEPPQRKPSSPPPRQLAPQQPYVIPEAVMEAEIIQERAGFGEGVAGHVARHLDTGAYADRAAHMGEAVDKSDRQLDDHLHKVFDHRVGSLASDYTSAIQDDVQDAYADKVVDPSQAAVITLEQMLANPRSLRNAFILSEIFKLPEL